MILLILILVSAGLVIGYRRWRKQRDFLEKHPKAQTFTKGFKQAGTADDNIFTRGRAAPMPDFKDLARFANIANDDTC